MITRDFLLRQIHQLAQVLARVLSLKSDQQPDQALQEIDRAFQDLPGLDVLLHATATRDELLALCRSDDRFHSEKALALADLLVERALLVEEEQKSGFKYALWLYEAAVSEGGAALPLDIRERIAWLREIDASGTAESEA